MVMAKRIRAAGRGGLIGLIKLVSLLNILQRSGRPCAALGQAARAPPPDRPAQSGFRDSFAARRTHSMDKVEAVVVGAGVVGLAVGRALAQRGLETLVLEREALIGSGVSSRHSEGIHSPLYYPARSLH